MQDLNDKVTGNSLLATEWNQVPSEIQNVIEGLGITLSSGDLNQLGKAIAGYAANGSEYSDGGVADSYVLSPTGSKQSVSSYANGHSFTFYPSNANTGACTANVSGLGVVSIKLRGGTTDPSAGDINPNLPCRIVYRSAPSAHFELDRSGMVRTNIVTASGAYAPPVDTRTLKFTAIGAGGGAGGVDGQGAGTAAVSCAGAGGGAAIKMTTQIEASYTIVVGAGGTGGAAGNNPGLAGGTTTVTSTTVNLSAGGGGGGNGNLGTATSQIIAGADGGTATGGDLNVRGSGTTNSIKVLGVVSAISFPGTSILGGGRRGVTEVNGLTGFNYGAGGGATSTVDVATNFAGGNGIDGAVIVEEYY